MNPYVKLGIATLLPTLFTILLYLADKKTSFGKLDKKLKQIIYGVVFGILAIIGTEWGIPMNNAQVNCRDGAVLCAGLIFGAPAGIIAGLIGGIERVFAGLFWHVGEFTIVACSVSTAIAGVYSAVLRKYMFEDKKPTWGLCFAIGIVMEVFHLTMVFLTNMDETTKAMAVVKSCTAPMLISNGLGVLFAAIAVSVFSREDVVPKKSNVRISQTIQRWLFVTVAVAFVATSVFVYSLQDKIALTQTDTLLGHALDEIEADIADVYDTTDDIDAEFVGLTKNRHVGETGYILVIDDKEYKVISGPVSLKETSVSEFGQVNVPGEDVTFRLAVDGVDSYCRYTIVEGYFVVSVLPVSEAYEMRNIVLYVNTFMEVLAFAILFALVYLLIKKVVVNRIKSINNSLSEITGGNLDVVVDVRTNEEFASLSDDINSTVETLKNYIEEASKRIDQELEFAKNIQSSALPSVFPAFPHRKDLDIYASMHPAKEVGGDFYDFYFTNGNIFNFLIADVSGKGIPAAMFMMRAKTELKSLAETDMPIGDVFTNSNNALCEGNDAGMFVTAWQGSVDLATGKLCYANAGHNPPLVKHANGKFEFLRGRAGFVLAGMEGVNYKEQELTLQKGDVVYLYTDGVTEATNKDNELYGEERLLSAINSQEFTSMKSLCEYVKADVDSFVGDNVQFDDITMVAFKYIGSYVKKIEFEKAQISDVTAVTEFIEKELELIDCPMKAVMQINVAIDEIFSNIVKYGYPKKAGHVAVTLTVKKDPHTVYVRFADEGIPYNPLMAKDPDITLSAEEREIGGLGIYIIKNTMDDVKYKYENGQNILTIKKIIE